MDYDTTACKHLIVAILQLAVREFIYGKQNLHQDAAQFLQSNQARGFFSVLGIDAGAACHSLNSNRQQYTEFVTRARVGDKSAQGDYREWWSEHFDYRPPEL
jgi:hypothetical protein